MTGGHVHGQGLRGRSSGRRHLRALALAFALTMGFGVVELVVGLLTGSLALLSDAAHMGTDVLGLGLALAAIVVANRSQVVQRTFGSYRLEVLAALANGVLLFGVAGYVLVEGVRRISEPPQVPGVPLLVTAVAGLVVNLMSFRILAAGSGESLNVRGAYLEVLADLLGSVGVIVAAVVLWTTRWAYVDPIVGILIGVAVLPRTWRLVRQALRILLEEAPPEIDLVRVREAIASFPGVREVHDVHVWTITSGMESVSAHIVVDGGVDRDALLDQVHTVLRLAFGLRHATVQCETATFASDEVGEVCHAPNS